MKITYKINYVCSDALNSNENIDFEFVKEGDYIPHDGFMLGGKYCVVSHTYYEVTTGEAVIHGTCYYPKNKSLSPLGEIIVKEAQQVAFNVIANLSEKYGIKGKYTSRK